jgi:hypothetical protein
MTTFVHCRGCGAQIHETAPTCPKCGAPQLLAAEPATATVALAPSSPPSAYSQVPWYRRRWFLIICILTVAPVVGVVALTGKMFYLSKGTVKTFPEGFKLVAVLLSIGYVISVIAPASGTAMWHLIAAVVCALGMGFKR